MNTKTQKLVYAALCLALCLVLPFLTGQIPEIGSMLCPMHLPVLIAGFLCGPGWAALVGFIAPPLRYLLFGMPPIFPTGIAMAFELAAYGFVTGMLYKALPKKPGFVYVALLCAMICGRIVSGIANLILYNMQGKEYTLTMFLTASFVKALPGIILQLVVVPVLVFALQKAKIIKD